jgi:hypothetical protein
MIILIVSTKHKLGRIQKECKNMFNPDGYMPNSMVEPYDLERDTEILNEKYEEKNQTEN